MLHFIYPSLCEGCGKTLIAQEEILCIECIALLPLTMYHCIAENQTVQRFAGRIVFENATSLAYYTKEGLLQHLLQEFKYRGNKRVGSFLGKKLGIALKKEGWSSNIDVIVPVPLHVKKSKSRGYNQSEIIAQQVAEILNVSIDNLNLIRIKNTDTQTRKSRIERAENMNEAFSVNDISAFSGKHILLLDDVLTTGSTIEGCVAALTAVRGIKISIATIGIATN
jgi:ComF family protein